ncbi:MAG TPA: hypothetical protein DCX53_16950 [Anaerolineae bacterium]|nr:hypothetical protein [Anaerolineae bacterium]
MKRFSVFVQALVITLVVSACGGQATPTITAVDQQSTAVAAALTILAETQSAIPTATPPLPTETLTNTPAPTNTFIPLPTEGADSTPVPGAGDPCATTLLPDSLTGTKIKIRIDNPTKVTINLSVNLQQSNAQGVCGYRGYTLAAQDSLVINDLVEGCYTLWAWNPDPDNYFIVTNGTSCLDSSKNWTFDILPGSIRLRE